MDIMTAQEQALIETMTIPANKREIIGKEVRRIIEANGGIITAEDFVEECRDARHVLHPYLTWSDKEAGRLLRLQEARLILRIAVEWVDNGHGKTEPVRVAVHISSDERGYRLLSSVISDAEMRDQLLADAERDVQTFRNRYISLKELHPAIRKLERSVRQAKNKRRKRG
jgi:hypothetical protein